MIGTQKEGRCALVDTAQALVAEAANRNFELLPHPSNSIDLASSDFFLFPKLRSYVGSCHFGKNNDVIWAVKKFLEDHDAVYFRD